MVIITYEDFAKVDILSGTIVKVEEFPKAKKAAYKIWVDFGPALGVKQTSAQVTKHYSLSSLIGRSVAGVVNLAPKNIAGFESQFLLLGFADEDGDVCLILSEPKVLNGKKLF